MKSWKVTIYIPCNFANSMKYSKHKNLYTLGVPTAGQPWYAMVDSVTHAYILQHALCIPSLTLSTAEMLEPKTN